jgi:hypothetical protein
MDLDSHLNNRVLKVQMVYNQVMSFGKLEDSTSIMPPSQFK